MHPKKFGSKKNSPKNTWVQGAGVILKAGGGGQHFGVKFIDLYEAFIPNLGLQWYVSCGG